VQTIIFDWSPTLRQSHKEWDALNETESRHTLLIARGLVLAVGALAVLIAYMSFGIMSFWVGMYSLMLSFFPAIFLSLRSQGGSHQRSELQVALSIVSGATAALIAAILGTFVFPSYSLLTALPPFVAVGISFIVMLPRPGDKQAARMAVVILIATAGLGYILSTRPSHGELAHDEEATKSQSCPTVVPLASTNTPTAPVDHSHGDDSVGRSSH
jgi:hypothetical protein